MVVGEDPERVVDNGVVHGVGDLGGRDAGGDQLVDRRLCVGRSFGPEIGLQAVGHVPAARSDGGLHERRTQHRDPDTGVHHLHFLHERLRQCDHAVLRHVVRAHQRCRGVTGHRRRVHDVGTLAVFDHRRQEHLAPVDHAPQVDADHPSPQIDVVGLGDRTTAADPGVVAQHVDVAEPVTREALQCSDVVEVRHVAMHASRRDADVAQAGDRLVEWPVLHVAQHHVHSRRTEALGHRQPDAARPAGDDGGLATQIIHPRSLVDRFARCRIDAAPRLTVARRRGIMGDG